MITEGGQDPGHHLGEEDNKDLEVEAEEGEHFEEDGEWEALEAGSDSEVGLPGEVASAPDCPVGDLDTLPGLVRNIPGLGQHRPQQAPGH